ncbi:hypothetical protein bcgnr5390_06600 [Bacillus luti]
MPLENSIYYIGVAIILVIIGNKKNLSVKILFISSLLFNFIY